MGDAPADSLLVLPVHELAEAETHVPGRVEECLGALAGQPRQRVKRSGHGFRMPRVGMVASGGKKKAPGEARGL